ncbi:MAG: M1 family metallopeptidase [Phycisphaerales bacterium]|nr:M1 family metallopeptidase [Phycisphaerae bacterium]NNF42647.1 M1 family metallopeptidase [Phycisphaerales bacterium]NNM26993.1 M1 family metallopeptidase [Phycisphaerales bacterium]
MQIRNPASVFVAAAVIVASVAIAADHDDDAIEKFDQIDKFRQLEEILPTPNAYRTASGAPGHGYWQQRADYEIDVEIDDDNQRLTGHETIHYFNNSPDTLRYLWVQLDANLYAPDSDAALISTAPRFEKMRPRDIKRLLKRAEFDGSATIERVVDADGDDLPHTIVKTMMRIDLPEPLAAGATTTFSIDWSYTINRSDEVRGRTACEYFEDDDNFLYEIAQWFPRMAPYNDVRGWHNKQFLGRGEFSLEFGNYLVRITVPADHVVASTGVLQNPDDVLTPRQRERLEIASRTDKPVFIVTPDEAKMNESSRSGDTRTWVYAAENVRDFAFATSRKFIWDAMLHDVEGNPVWAMSYYPNEGEPLWSRYSTHAIMHTLDVYSKYTFTYPYPVAISVNGPVGGMEYPMICFNGPRPEEDGTYSKRTKYGLISVIIHEVGHNYFPMIVNSDERQWTWMDEGLNTFVQYLTEQEWEEEYPSRRGEPRNIVGYMRSTNQVPIMTNSESLLQFGSNAYAKPATALNILRETILGRELFDFAFKEYARRWQFKAPMPADLFRSMEDASGIDLDWFWRGWFYTTDHTDIAIEGVKVYEMKTGDLDEDSAISKAERDDEPESLSERRNRALAKRTERFPELLDFYNEFDELDVTKDDRRRFQRFLDRLEDDDAEYLGREERFYVVDFRNKGGLVMPLILAIEYESGRTEELRIPAEIWRKDNERVSKLLLANEPIVRIELDPHLETADIDLSNNTWPPEPVESRFRLYKDRKDKNPMQELEQKLEDDVALDDEDEEEQKRKGDGWR